MEVPYERARDMGTVRNREALNSESYRTVKNAWYGIMGTERPFRGQGFQAMVDYANNCLVIDRHSYGAKYGPVLRSSFGVIGIGEAPLVRERTMDNQTGVRFVENGWDILGFEKVSRPNPGVFGELPRYNPDRLLPGQILTHQYLKMSGGQIYTYIGEGVAYVVKGIYYPGMLGYAG
jgi:hypothetical protein